VNVPFHIAKRYLFSKKSHNIINIISGIAVVGITFSTAALIVILSAFNGLEGLVSDLYNSFDSDIEITLKEGKTFDKKLFPLEEIKALEEVEYTSNIVEEVVMLKHRDNWVTCNMKGVEPSFMEMAQLDTFMVDGIENIFEHQRPEAIIGLGIQSQLGVSSDDVFDNLMTVSGLLRDKKIKRNSNPFKQKEIHNIGVFSIGPDFDFKYIIAPIDFASDLLNYEDEITAVELNLKAGVSHDEFKTKLQTIVGEDFDIKTLYEQNELVYNVHKLEKWFIYIILTFVLLLASFNILASLAMLIIDKKKDIYILKSMGANDTDVRKIFFFQGTMINLSGAIIGLGLGLFVAWLQIKFHLVTLQGAIIDYYPVEIKAGDIAMVGATVLLIGISSSYFPVRYFLRKY